MAPERRRLAVVVVAFGDPASLRSCLGALPAGAAVHVVDNSSSPDVAAVAQELGVRYSDPGTNCGFAKGVNLGLLDLDLRATDVLLLNPDAVIGANAVEMLRDELDRRPRLAAVAPLQRRRPAGAAVRVWWPFDTPLGAWADALGLTRLLRRHFLAASVLLLRGQALADVGRFDESFPLYAEEQDWQRRALRRGWEVDLRVDAEALHAGGGSDGDARRRSARLHAGTEHYVRKWYGRAGWQLYRAGAIAGALRRTLTSRGAARRGSWQVACRYATGPERAARRDGDLPLSSPSRPVPSASRH